MMTSLLLQGLNLTALGMGVVFILLTLLVGIIHAMSALCRRIEGASAGVSATVPAPAQGSLTNPELISVISAAIQAHHSRQTRP
jgi:sodium pump decarboxylase gamma subunit